MHVLHVNMCLASNYSSRQGHGGSLGSSVKRTICKFWEDLQRKNPAATVVRTQVPVPDCLAGGGLQEWSDLCLGLQTEQASSILPPNFSDAKLSYCSVPNADAKPVTVPWHVGCIQR